MNLKQLLILPLANTYGCVTCFRNKLFDWKILPSEEFDLPVISVGNLSAGGTGKTPHVEYIVRLLYKRNQVAILSRGYKRSTSGFILANKQSTYKEIGDEPLQYKQKFDDILVVADESRRSGIKILTRHFPNLKAIILDDAFQHRYVKPGLSILTTDFHNLYANDYMLPSGTLREFRKGAKRADIILVTKTSKVLSPITVRRITDLIKPQKHQHLFFTFIDYGDMIPLNGSTDMISPDQCNNVLMFSGIANSYPLQNYLSSQYKNLVQVRFPDHHAYTRKDFIKIRENFRQILSNKKIIITTEKDAMRLKTPEMKPLFDELPIYYIPIEIKFHNEDNVIFDARIINYVEKHQRSHTIPEKSGS